MKLSSIFLSLTSIFLLVSGCSNSENEPEPPTVIETAPIAQIPNSDGSYYTLHDFYISLRNSSDVVIKRLEFVAPKPIEINIGYGEKKEAQYRPAAFGKLGSDIAACYCANYYSAGTNQWVYSLATGYVYLFNNALTSYSVKEIANGEMLCQNNLLVSVKEGFGFSLYNESLNILKMSNGIENLECPSLDPDDILCQIDNKYYLLCQARVYNRLGTSVIVNLSDETFNEIQTLSINDIIQENFSQEIHEPRLEKLVYSLEGNHFVATYIFTLFDGSVKSISYKFGLNGELLRGGN